MAYDGAVRLCEKKPKTPKDPISPEIIKFLFEQFSSECLLELRFLVMCALWFFGFFRIEDELLTVKLYNVKIIETHLEVFLEKSKNDQHLDGKTVYISKFDSKYCPVKILQKFFSQGEISLGLHKDMFLIPRLLKSNQGIESIKH